MKTVILILTIGLFFTSCTEAPKNTADKDLAKKTSQAMEEANKQVGYPAIVNFQEKKLMKTIYELRDQENLVCHAYLYNRNTGEVGQYLGKCIGYGLPYSTQFSNPEKMVVGSDLVGYSSHGYATIQTMPQPEPNGLFMPEGMAATWLLLLDEKGTPHPVYVEPEIIVSPFKLK